MVALDLSARPGLVCILVPRTRLMPQGMQIGPSSEKQQKGAGVCFVQTLQWNSLIVVSPCWKLRLSGPSYFRIGGRVSVALLQNDKRPSGRFRSAARSHPAVRVPL